MRKAGACGWSHARFHSSRQFDGAHFIAADAERGDQPIEMRTVAGFAFHIGDQPLGRQGGEHALVIDFDDIDALGIENPRDVEQCAGLVLDRKSVV